MSHANFKLTESPVFEDNPELLAIPEFTRLTERQMRYVMLVDWLQSPLRLMQEENRKLKAALMSGYLMEKDGKRPDMNTRNLIQGKVANVEVARRIMQEIQHDHEKDILTALDVQIKEIVDFLKLPNKTPMQLDKAVQLISKFPVILENRKKIMEILNFRSTEIVDVMEEQLKSDESELSFLDKLDD